MLKIDEVIQSFSTFWFFLRRSDADEIVISSLRFPKGQGRDYKQR